MRCPQGGAAPRALYGYLLFAMEVTGAGDGGTHTLACKVESSVGRRGTGVSASLSRLQCQRANFSLLVWKMFGFALRKKKGEKIKKSRIVEVPQIRGEGGKNNKQKTPQTNPNSTPKCSHYRRTKKSKDGAAQQAGNWCALPPAPLLLGPRRRRGFQAPEPTSFILWVSLTLLEPGGKGKKREKKP